MWWAGDGRGGWALGRRRLGLRRWGDLGREGALRDLRAESGAEEASVARDLANERSRDCARGRPVRVLASELQDRALGADGEVTAHVFD